MFVLKNSNYKGAAQRPTTVPAIKRKLRFNPARDKRTLAG
jgi:hypothetical protein